MKLLRAAAEFCNDGENQNYLGVLYNAGAGVVVKMTKSGSLVLAVSA